MPKITTNDIINYIQQNPDALKNEAARRNLLFFARRILPTFERTQFHETYYKILDLFAHGKLKKLIIQAPPQHGKSLGSSRLLPAFMLGSNPDTKICICSYSATIARDFNRDVQRLIDNNEYASIFPETKLNSSNVVTVSSNYLRNSECFEIVNHIGNLRVVGRGGSLTSKTVDVMILDDLYKDAAEANSPVVREGAWNWYTKVARTRLHNQSQELIVFTRWHQSDIIGKLMESEPTITAKTESDIEEAEKTGAWLIVNFEAIKTGEPSELDRRKPGEALWEKRHSLERLLQQKALDPVGFQCLFQGKPESAEGRLFQPFKTWINKEEFGTYIRTGCYIDVADEGDDYFAAATYEIYKSENQTYNEQLRKWQPIIYALITDIDYTNENTEVTSITTPQMINRNGVQRVYAESNNGGSLYVKAITPKVRAQIVQFYQSANKESRIITSAPFVNTQIIMPFGWQERFPKVYQHLTTFLREFSANEHDDIEDCICGIYEKEIAQGNIMPYNQANRGVRRIN